MAVNIWSFLCVMTLSAVSAPSPLAVLLASGFVFFPPKLWEQIVAATTPFQLVGLILPFLVILTYWVNGLLLLAFDVYKRPSVLQTFKIQPTKSFDVSKLRKVVSNLLIGQFFVLWPFAMLAGVLCELGIGVQISPEIPHPKELILYYIGYVVTDEILFFYGHWALHHPLFYSKIHKIHHEFTSPVGLVAAYCHPFEMIVSNVLPLGIGVVLFRSHAFTAISWSVFAVLGTQTHHCGYRWPWIARWDHQPNFHDFHHEVFSSNYGMMGWLDRLHGTDTKWQKKIAANKAAGKDIYWG
eukprot:TRINITY_DN40489_c0_g1_i1.p1 TRINITY_DN40489_c0_g1~~TRINITY_DN40489_c0_g1_i1.p1  ORF type:complete len:304 (-),score=35.61 TRINITY_DN40489_c0_g1_i1:101-991(-)